MTCKWECTDTVITVVCVTDEALATQENWATRIMERFHQTGACTSQGTTCFLNSASTCTHKRQASNRLKGSSISNATIKTSCFFLKNNSMPTLKMVKIKLTSWGCLHIPKYKVLLYFNQVQGDQVGPAGVFAECGEGNTAGRKLWGLRHGPEVPRVRVLEAGPKHTKGGRWCLITSSSGLPLHPVRKSEGVKEKVLGTPQG